MSKTTVRNPLLQPWMYWLLRIAGTFNLLAGAAMFCLFHEGYKLMDLPKPEVILPVQIMGILVALFGVGYHMVAADPLTNRNILLLGMLSKAIAATVAYWYVVFGPLGWAFGVSVFFSDAIYVPPFYVIYRQLRRAAAETAG